MSSYRACVDKALLRLDAEKVEGILAETFKNDPRGISLTIDPHGRYVTYELRD